VHFHWERTEEQRFRGALEIIEEGATLTAVNVASLEDYLTSVISSEMNAAAPMELLKAHAVISRGWILAQREKRKSPPADRPATRGEDIRWFDREEHLLYDVCADDHCQRYQGIGRENERAARAVNSTRGQVLVYQGKICDTRFSKCCGGATERFESAWAADHHPYLVKVDDRADGPASPDLRDEEHAREWILSRPRADCDVADEQLLGNCLNDYDRETRDFFRWSVSYAADELSAIVRERLRVDIGDLVDLQPVERGDSGRLTRLRLVGTLDSIVIGKELYIRQALSRTHLFSSAFVPVIERDLDGNPRRFTLRGAGWGHGVGLCQVGAAAMSANGSSYREILARYFPAAQLQTVY
jgi:SpoIID/LytB domain protein